MFRLLKSRKGSAADTERGEKLAKLTFERDAQRLETERSQDRMKEIRVKLLLDDGEGNIPPATKKVLDGAFVVIMAKVAGIGNLTPLLQALLGGH
ncbi:hypothetical protein NE235_35830 [Actinoallomurus spadix]|uniref:Uncharacterized protein n=1 Tax=Actinoallomurus spadix TaxID=79912 RepID=A0ABN0WL54_9ACTN|nr:hypothetical protein [Actinoallomurus spadix]MCO5991499.1 hypothetical protein [Actinoallomurus spadix]